MLSLVDRAEPIDGVAVPDPREPGAIVARVTCGPSSACSLTTVGCAESGEVSSDRFSLAIVAAMVVVERGRDGGN